MFNNYRIPREYLLNKNADVDENGRYVTAIKDPNEMHGKSLGGLSGGRCSIINIAFVYLTKAVTIAIRYAAVRKQFGPEGVEELPVLEYQLHVSNRLSLVQTFSSRLFRFRFYKFFVNAIESLIFGINLGAQYFNQI